MILRFFFMTVFLPLMELYVKVFVWAEKLYRRTTGKSEPGVPSHLQDWQVPPDDS